MKFQMDKNQVEFTVLTFGRVAPALVISVVNDDRISLLEEIAVTNPKERKTIYLNSKLFLERYERNAYQVADEMTKSELGTLGILPPPPPVSTGKGKPPADTFAQPTGLAGSAQLPQGQNPDKQ